MTKENKRKTIEIKTDEKDKKGQKWQRRTISKDNLICQKIDDIRYNGQLSLNLVDCMVDCEVHMPNGYIVYLYECLREHYKVEWDAAKNDATRLAVFKEFAFRLRMGLVLGMLCYLQAASYSTVHEWALHVMKHLRNSTQLKIDRKIFKLLNSYMPMKNFVQLNVTHNVMKIYQVLNVLESSKLGLYSTLDVVGSELINDMTLFFSIKGVENEFLKSIASILKDECILVSSFDDMEARALKRMCPDLKIQQADITVVKLQDTIDWYEKYIGQMRSDDIMTWYAKVRNDKYAVAFKSGVCLCEADPRCEDYNIIMRVKPTMWYNRRKLVSDAGVDEDFGLLTMPVVGDAKIEEYAKEYLALDKKINVMIDKFGALGTDPSDTQKAQVFKETAEMQKDFKDLSVRVKKDMDLMHQRRKTQVLRIDDFKIRQKSYRVAQSAQQDIEVQVGFDHYVRLPKVFSGLQKFDKERWKVVLDAVKALPKDGKRYIVTHDQWQQATKWIVSGVGSAFMFR